jgi:hypothetical protein
MPRSGGRLRILEHGSQALDLSRTETGLIRLRMGPREIAEPERHFDLDPSEARAVAYSLLAAAERDTRRVADDGADWPEEYWAQGTFPADELRDRDDSN